MIDKYNKLLTICAVSIDTAVREQKRAEVAEEKLATLNLGYGRGTFTRHFTFDEYMKIENDSDDPNMPLSDRVQAILEQEQGRWQSRLEEVYGNVEGVHNIDGSACDSGDPLDLTESEVAQVIHQLTDQRDNEKRRAEVAERALRNKLAELDLCSDSDRETTAAELARETFIDHCDKHGAYTRSEITGECFDCTDELAKEQVKE